MIGIFWIYQEQIFAKTVPVDSVMPIAGYVDSDFAHYTVWDEIVRRHPEVYLYEYEEVPRGRVVFDIDKTQYIVYAHPNIIENEKKRTLVIETFKLHENTVLFKPDEHYYCATHVKYEI